MRISNKTAKRLAGGGAVGLVNGVFGGGGGMIAVPLLERIERRGTAAAHATAIACILPASLVSVIVYLWAGLAPWRIFLPVAIGAGLGGVLGAKLLGGLPLSVVRLIFVAVMLAAGIRMVLP